jgi:hypothetical protein
MCQRTIRRVQDEEVQHVINKEAERRLLAVYINGLKGVTGQQVVSDAQYNGAGCEIGRDYRECRAA